jgi:insertion element IS1 protein InsB
VGDERDGRLVWMAPGAGTRQVVGMVAGDRTERPPGGCGRPSRPSTGTGPSCTPTSSAQYRAVVPAACHTAAGKEVGSTDPAERFWWTLRKRCARFVRETRSFFSCPLNHMGAPWYFVRLYNASRL